MLKAFGVEVDPEEIKRNIEQMRAIVADAAQRLQRIESKVDICVSALAAVDGPPEVEDRYDAIARAVEEKNAGRSN